MINPKKYLLITGICIIWRRMVGGCQEALCQNHGLDRVEKGLLHQDIKLTLYSLLPDFEGLPVTVTIVTEGRHKDLAATDIGVNKKVRLRANDLALA